MPFRPGEQLGDYEILRLLGAGGMGEVYQVRNVLSDRVDAIKVLSSGLQANPDLQERFLREIKISAGLRHPHIAELRTAQRVDGLLIMVMEFVDGVTVDTLLREGPLPPNNALHYTSQLLQALAFAHERGVVHRDIKPQNIMVTAGDEVRLMDFGIARSLADQGMTMTGMTLGSLYYMSPEQIRGEHADHRADLYSLGIALYEMVTASRPFEGSSGYTVMAAHLDQPPAPPVDRNPALPDGLNDIILKAIEKRPEDRFQDAGDFLRAIMHLQASLPGGIDAGILQRALAVRAEAGADATARPSGLETPTQTLPVTPTPPGGKRVHRETAAMASPSSLEAPSHGGTPAAVTALPARTTRFDKWIAIGGMAMGLLAILFIFGPRAWNLLTGGNAETPRETRRQGGRVWQQGPELPPGAPQAPAFEGPRTGDPNGRLPQDVEVRVQEAMQAAEAAMKEAGIDFTFSGADGRANRRFGGLDRAEAMVSIAKRYRAAHERRELLAERRRSIPNLIRAMTEQERQATMSAMGDQWRQVTESLAAAEAALKSQNMRLAGEELAVAESAMDAVDRALTAIQRRHGGAEFARP